MIDRQGHPGPVQLRLVEQVAVPGVELSMGIRLRLEEHGRRAVPGRVPEPEARPAIGPVVPDQQRDVGDLSLGMPSPNRGVHPLRRDVVPVGRDVIGAYDHRHLRRPMYGLTRPVGPIPGKGRDRAD